MRASKRDDSDPVDDRQGPDLFLNVANVQRMMRSARWNRAELARQMYMDQSAINRLLDGELQPGHRSIASLLVAAWRFEEPEECLCGTLFDFVDETGRLVLPPHARPRQDAAP